jgi:hypothetical protein
MFKIQAASKKWWVVQAALGECVSGKECIEGESAIENKNIFERYITTAWSTAVLSRNYGNKGGSINTLGIRQLPRND